MTLAYEKYLKEVLLDERTLQQRIAELGAQISMDYADCDDLMLLCILKGGVMFLTDLSRHILVPHVIDFMAASSYGFGARQSSGSVRIDMDLRMDVKGKHVLVCRRYHRQRLYPGLRHQDAAKSRAGEPAALRAAQQAVAPGSRHSGRLYRL